MTATLSRVEVWGFEAYLLESSDMRVIVIPSLGGRVWEVVDRERDRQWIWHREGVGLAVQAAGSVYDDVWPGGWEQLFPNDAPGDFRGHALPDHGEWWTASWTVCEATSGPDAVLQLAWESRVRRSRCTKEFSLAAESDTLDVRYRIESLEPEPFYFLFKEHLAVALSPSCSLALPGGSVTAVDPAFGTLLEGLGPYDWPAPPDLSRVRPPSSDAREFVYVADLPEGWCGIDDRAAGASLRLTFDRAVFPFVWLFLSYGGWRDCYTAVLEPCSNMPKDLATAVARGHSAQLAPGAVFETRVALTTRGLASTGG